MQENIEIKFHSQLGKVENVKQKKNSVKNKVVFHINVKSHLGGEGKRLLLFYTYCETQFKHTFTIYMYIKHLLRILTKNGQQ